MLTKLLVTIGVIVAVAMIYRTKRMPDAQPVEAPAESNSGIKPRTVAYALVTIAVLASIYFFYLKYTNDMQIMLIRITGSATGEIVSYEAYRRDIKGNSFTTIDGRQVTIGDAERYEVLTKQ